MNKKMKMVFRNCVFISLLLFTLISCEGYRRQLPTPEEYLSTVRVSKEKYDSDKSKIMVQLKKGLLSRSGFFANTSYSDSTEIFIDSIFYSPDSVRMATIFFIRNPTYKQLLPDNRSKRYFDATIYLAKKSSDSVKTYFFGPRFSNSIDSIYLLKTLRYEGLNNFAEKDSTGMQVEYNLNDKRFWTSKYWDRF